MINLVPLGNRIRISVTSKLFGDNLQSDMFEIKNASRLTHSLTRSYTPQIQQTSGINLKHKINNTEQSKPFLGKDSRGYRPH